MARRSSDEENNAAAPVLKWAGGKSQLLSAYADLFPKDLKEGRIKTYVEPFVGGGAVFFYVAASFKVENFIINDFNPELMLVYQVIKEEPEKLIEALKDIQCHYHSLNAENQSKYFYDCRDSFNADREAVDFDNYGSAWLTRAAQIIFLNRTCFNGLFRVNSKGGFNVPFGKYKNPRICFEENLIKVSKVLEKTRILCGDFTNCEEFVLSNSFVYLDPPYRPLNKTSSFTSYSTSSFNDEEQRRLASHFRELDKRGALLMLSNSDPKNEDGEDPFFDELYSGFNIQRINASRMINSNASKRGAISEVVVTNY